MAKILLVEDNEMNRDVLSRLLKRRGYELFFAEDGESAIQMTLELAPDLILMDISLPKMDGNEATQHLRAQSACAHLPIIALTAHAMASDRDKAMAAGCTDYETKPVDFPRLLEKIEKHLKQVKP
ncbi:response regulator [Holophaga foetida]|uniref:response regulator n=1 Tax=Holophaga foetida TaxID=35839 RepID=UPI0002472AA5|nr:response regulator [Holophaga foetida]